MVLIVDHSIDGSTVFCIDGTNPLVIIEICWIRVMMRGKDRTIVTIHTQVVKIGTNHAIGRVVSNLKLDVLISITKDTGGSIGDTLRFTGIHRMVKNGFLRAYYCDFSRIFPGRHEHTSA